MYIYLYAYLFYKFQSFYHMYFISHFSGYNLTYMIPAGVADDMFKIDAETGVVTLARSLDRETVDQYNLVVHVTDSKSGDYDTTNVFITILDVNDNAPEFKSGSCYPITIPENSEAANVHTFIATDLDLGLNSQITYSITGECWLTTRIIDNAGLLLVLAYNYLLFNEVYP